MEVTETEFRLTGSNSESSLKFVLPIDDEVLTVEETGSTVLQKKVLDIMKKIKTGNVTLETDENDFTSITSSKKKAEFSVPGFSADEYPKLTQISNDEQPTVTINGHEFQDIVRRTAFCASTSETRPILQAVLFDVQQDCINFIATDSHRLSHLKRAHDCQKESKYPIPSLSIVQMTRVFDLDQEIEFYVLSDTQAIFRNGNTTFYSRLLEGNYPDTSKLISHDYKTKLHVNRKEFEEALETMAVLADDKKSTVVKLTIDGMLISLESASNDSSTGKGKVEIAYNNLEGDSFTISFSCKFALDSVRSFTEDEIEITFNGNMRPFYIKPTESLVDVIQLVLPVRTNN